MKGDDAIQAGADKLEELSEKAAAGSGVTRKLAPELADDAAFLRKLKPSLIVKRAKGELPKDAEPGAGTPQAPSSPQHARPKRTGGDANPIAVAALAFGVGTLLAKAIDWRGHAHPRR